jgi:RecA-family ATPase
MTVHGPQPFTSEGERASRFFSLADLAGKPIPPREWLVEDLVPMRQVTLFSGDGGTGKSLLALQLAVAVAGGQPWLWRGARKGSAIFISAEDDEDELHRRAADVLRAGQLGFADMKGLTVRSLAGEDALLAVESEMRLMKSALFDELQQRAADQGPELVVIDTAADVFPSNENDRRAVRQFIGILRGLAIRQRCAVVLLSHPSLTGLASGSGTSGSTAWNNSVRSRLYLNRITDNGYEADPDKRILTVMKSNYARRGNEIGLTWRDGAFWPDASQGRLDRAAASQKAERVFVGLLRQFSDQGRYVSPNPSNSYAPATFAKHPEAEGVTKRAFQDAMEVLLRRGAVMIAEHGRGASKKQHLEVAP